MTKIVFEEFTKELKLRKLLLYLSSGGHGDRSTRLFGSWTKAFVMVNDHWLAVILSAVINTYFTPFLDKTNPKIFLINPRIMFKTILDYF